MNPIRQVKVGLRAENLDFRRILVIPAVRRSLGHTFVQLPPQPKNVDFCKKKLSDELVTLGIHRERVLNIS